MKFIELASKLYFKATAKMKTEDGATSVEYALIIGLISIAIITVAALLGDNIVALFQRAADAVGGAGN